MSASAPLRTSENYIGRFAPSPTGPLHIGSLLAALASYLDAKAHQGQWLVRIEDLDPPREVPGASDQILRTLEHFGLHWDGTAIYQSQRSEAYEEAITKLIDSGMAYHCDCSRTEIQNRGAIHYDNYCRSRQNSVSSPSAVRVVTTDAKISFDDRLQGPQHSQLQQDCGDFVIRRKDGLYAYQLAVVVDDAAQNITHIVRGSDLLDSTARQIYLQQLLQLHRPSYGHIPVIVNALGQKLSKQTFAPAIDSAPPVPTLLAALGVLGLPVKLLNPGESVANILEWAARHWSLQALPAVQSIPEDKL